jgi:hypothetical protein
MTALKGGGDVLRSGIMMARLFPMRADRLENACQYGGIHLPVAAKTIVMGGLDTPFGGLLENRVQGIHERFDACILGSVG